jgi:site-specific DNA recombinase
MRMAKKPAREAPQAERKRCAIYTRKSTTHGLNQEFNSLDAQYEACQSYVRARTHDGWTLSPARYDDGGASGKDTDRQHFQRLMADVDAGKIDVVVVYKLDRLSRSLRDFHALLERFERAGCTFVSITQNLSTEGAMGKLILNLLMVVAEFERENSAERTRDKIRATRRRGKWTGGMVPLGYRTEDKKLVIDGRDAPLVRDIFTLYPRLGSALAVARALNDEHRWVPGRTLTDGKQRPAHPWTKHDVLRVVSNPVYAGYMPYGEELNEGEHEPIVTRVIYHRVRALIDGQRREVAVPGRSPAYLLRGLLRCKGCGAAMTPASTTAKGRTYRYYRCVTRDKRGREACATVPMAAAAIETSVIDHLRAKVRATDLAADVSAAAAQQIAAARETLTAERRSLPRQIAQLGAEGHRLAAALAEGDDAERRLIGERAEACAAELACSEGRLRLVEKRLAALETAEANVDWVAGILADFDGAWDLLTVDNQGQLLRALIAHVETDGNGWEIRLAETDLVTGDTAGEARRAAA